MKLDIKDIVSKLQPEVLFVKHYASFMYVVLLLIIFGFFVFRINQLSSLEPSDTSVDDKLQTVQRPKIDEDVLNKIQQLESQNIQVQSLFESYRNNPFSE